MQTPLQLYKQPRHDGSCQTQPAKRQYPDYYEQEEDTDRNPQQAGDDDNGCKTYEGHDGGGDSNAGENE